MVNRLLLLDDDLTAKTVFGSNLMLWTDASVLSSMLDSSGVIITDGGAIQTWQDLSGRGNNMTNTNSGQRPLYRATAAGMPSVECFADGDFDFLRHADSTDFDYTDLTVMLFLQQKTSGTTQSPFGKYLTTGNQREFDMRITSPGQNFVVNSSSDGTSGFSSASALDTISTGTTYAFIFTYTNGVKTAQVNNNTGNAGTDTATIFKGTGEPQLGGISGSVQPFKGYLREAIVATQVLSAGAQAAFINAQRNKWGF